MTSMTHTAEQTSLAATEGPVTTWFGRFFDMVVSLPGAARAARDIERLSAMTDEQLAQRGFRRDDVASSVMMRHMNI